MESGCSTVGRAVPSDIRYPQFESFHQQVYLQSTELKNSLEKTNRKEKGPGIPQILKQ